MNIIIVSVHVAAAIILVLTVLLQAGKGAGMGAAFGGSSGTVFGTRGPATLISKVTCAAAVVFMITSLNLSLSQSNLHKGSVMDQWSDVPAASSPAVPADMLATPAPKAESAPAEPAPAATDEAATVEPAADEAAAIDAGEAQSDTPALTGDDAAPASSDAADAADEPGSSESPEPAE